MLMYELFNRKTESVKVCLSVCVCVCVCVCLGVYLWLFLYMWDYGSVVCEDVTVSVSMLNRGKHSFLAQVVGCFPITRINQSQ